MKWAGTMTALGLAAALWAATGAAWAQQATVATPSSTARHGFFEHIRTSWGIDAPGFTFRFGAPNLASPPFGTYTPGAGGNLGFGFRRKGTTVFFDAEFAQGAQQSLSSQVPIITLTQGSPGRVADSSVAPFVIGYVPVAGACPILPVVVFDPSMSPLGASSAALGSDAPNWRFSPAQSQQVKTGSRAFGRPAVNQAQCGTPAGELGGATRACLGGQAVSGNCPGQSSESKPQADPKDPGLAQKLVLAQTSSAGRVVPSMEEARKMRAAEEQSRQAEAEVYYERGQTAEAAGHLGAAHIYYQMAARRASGERKQQILKRLAALKIAGSAHAEP